MMVLSPPTKTFRVAFMSAFFREHSVGRLLRNVIKYIASHQQSMGDQFEIEVVLVHVRIFATCFDHLLLRHVVFTDSPERLAVRGAFNGPNFYRFRNFYV